MCCQEELGQPKDIPDTKNPAGISHYLRFTERCKCDCDKLKQKVADLEYDVEQLRLQLEREGIVRIPLRIRNYTNETEVERISN